jgi:hypothetical protein
MYATLSSLPPSDCEEYEISPDVDGRMDGERLAAPICPKMGRNLREEGGGQGGSPELSAPFQFPWETISFFCLLFYREIRAFSSFGF